MEKYRKTGKKNHVGELYNRYAHLVFGVCMKYLKNQQQAEDATVEVFEKLLVDLKTKEVETFRAWIYVVSKNHSLMILRKASRLREKKQQYEAVAAEHGNSSDDKVLLEGRFEALEHAINHLKPEQKQCVELFFLEKRSYKEIVDLTGFSLKTVKSHIQNGKRNLKITLEQRDEFKQ